jgi:hypothetical protein
MDPRSQTLLFGDPLKQGAELLPLLFTQSGAQGGIVLASHATDGFERLPALLSQVQSVAPTVIGAVAAFYETASFKFVYQDDEAAREDAQNLAERLLAETSTGAEDAEDTRVRRGESEGR